MTDAASRTRIDEKTDEQKNVQQQEKKDTQYTKQQKAHGSAATVEWIFQKLKYICSADFLIQAVFYNKNKFWTMKRPLAFMTEAR